MSPELAGMFNALLAEELGDQATLAMALVALSVRIDPTLVADAATTATEATATAETATA